MKSILFLFVLININNAFLHFNKHSSENTTDHRVLGNVKIYSNLAEIIQPLGKLPLEFSEDDWRDIRSDSVTLVGTNVNITQQTVTEKKQSLNNAHIFVRAPSSSNTETKFVKATLIDERRNLVKLIDKDISKDPIFFTASSDHIVYDHDPPQSKYYVNFTFDTTDAVYVSYLRSNLNWKTRYQLNLFNESKNAVLISMADIRNDGQSRVDIEHAELLGGDINLQMYPSTQWTPRHFMPQEAMYSHSAAMDGASAKASVPSISQGEEVAGLYAFAINKPFSIEGKTNYLLPMFRPQVTVERYALISKYFQNAGASTGKAQRSYRLSSDRYLSRGNCVIREYDRLVGETSLPNIAATNKHEFSIGEDADVIYKENVTLISSEAMSPSTSMYQVVKTKSTYNVNLVLKSYKNRPFKLEYEEQVHGSSIKLIHKYTEFTVESSKVKYKTTLGPNEEKILSYKLEIIS